jgi:hypothetical protein
MSSTFKIRFHTWVMKKSINSEDFLNSTILSYFLRGNGHFFDKYCGSSLNWIHYTVNNSDSLWIIRLVVAYKMVSSVNSHVFRHLQGWTRTDVTVNYFQHR